MDTSVPASVAEWDAHIAASTSFVEAQERIDEAVKAGVDLAALLDEQAKRARFL